MIYIDMDGVLANFDMGVTALYGSLAAFNENQEAFWNIDCIELDFFQTLGAIPEGIAMLRSIARSGQPFCVLTSTGGGRHHHEIGRQKAAWLREHTDSNVPVAYCPGTASKLQFCSTGDYLIDDREFIVDQWNSRGGYAWVFKPNETKRLLTMLGVSLSTDEHRGDPA